MPRKAGEWMGRAAALCVLVAAIPAAATVKDGVDAWSRGDYAAAVSQWEGPAQAGDVDAMFNLAQAYRLGRGVPADPARAEALYSAAAAAGHLQAADTLGLMLFQDGRREQALPYVTAAARRGDPRSQYLLGIAHFNGDLVERDWTRAYALLTMANGAGLPQAASALVEMDAVVPLAQRQEAAGLAVRLQAEADSARASELASADLGSATPVARPAAPAAARPPQVAVATPRVSRPTPTTTVSPSVAAARAAVEEASQATGTSSPADAGASYASGTQAAAATPQARPVAARPAAQSVAATPNTGPWRVQLGAFSVAGNAESLWTRLSSRAELAGKQRLLISAGRVTKLQAGGFASQAAANSACNALKSSGQDCLVTRN